MLATAHTIFFYSLVENAGVLGLTAGALGFAWWQRSITVAAVACVLVVLAGGWFEPWLALVPAFSADPQAAQWLAWRRFLSIGWVLLALAGPTCLITLIQLRRL